MKKIFLNTLLAFLSFASIYAYEVDIKNRSKTYEMWIGFPSYTKEENWKTIVIMGKTIKLNYKNLYQVLQDKSWSNTYTKPQSERSEFYIAIIPMKYTSIFVKDEKKAKMPIGPKLLVKERKELFRYTPPSLGPTMEVTKIEETIVGAIYKISNPEKKDVNLEIDYNGLTDTFSLISKDKDISVELMQRNFYRYIN